MKIEGTPKEIADIVVILQGQPNQLNVDAILRELNHRICQALPEREKEAGQGKRGRMKDLIELLNKDRHSKTEEERVLAVKREIWEEMQRIPFDDFVKNELVVAFDAKKSAYVITLIL